MLQHMDGSQFDWLSWRAGDPHRMFGVSARTLSLRVAHETIRQYAIGWCRGENVLCRPKVGQIAVMFEIAEQRGWFHMRQHEFESIFSEA